MKLKLSISALILLVSVSTYAADPEVKCIQTNSVPVPGTFDELANQVLDEIWSEIGPLNKAAKEAALKLDNLQESVEKVLARLIKEGTAPQITFYDIGVRRLVKDVMPDATEEEVKLQIREIGQRVEPSTKEYKEFLTKMIVKQIEAYRFRVERIMPVLESLDPEALKHLEKVYGEGTKEKLKSLLMVEVGQVIKNGDGFSAGLVITYYRNPAYKHYPLKYRGKAHQLVAKITNPSTLFDAVIKEVFGSEDVYFAYLPHELKPEVNRVKGLHPQMDNIRRDATKIEEVSHWLDLQKDPHYRDYYFAIGEKRSLSFLYSSARLTKGINLWLDQHPQFDKLVQHMRGELSEPNLTKEEVKAGILDSFYKGQMELFAYRHSVLEINGKWSALQYLKKKYGLSFDEYVELGNTGKIRGKDAEPRYSEELMSFRTFPQNEEYYKQMYHSKTPPTDLNPYYRVFDFLRKNTELSVKDATRMATRIAKKYGSQPEIMGSFMSRMERMWKEVGTLLE